MHIQLTETMFKDKFHAVRPDNFSYEALSVLYEYLEEVNPESELDVISICCEYQESDEDELRDDYDVPEDADIQEWLEEQTHVIGVTSHTFIFQCF